MFDMSPQTIEASIYDFPVYYDLIFGSDWAAEYKFLNAVFKKHITPLKGKSRPIRLIEPACGTGRLIYRFSKASVHCDGFDLNQRAIEFCNQRLKKAGLRESSWVADMTDFTVRKPYDAAFNTINSFRHLSSEQAALDHFRCLADAVRPGGIYVLGFHLTPKKGTPTDEESWSARRGHLVINTRMWPKDKNPKKRVEQFHLRFDVHRPTQQFRIDDVLVLRSYSHRQFQSMIDKTDWFVDETYDFRYSADDSIEIDDWTEDVVYILKRK
jgi:SAM-dependent methyltransferase